ncbi:L,D-transpeptidase family protein [Nocardioides sp. dk4132]|uniref:L,D-transpeptidase n=1 Tax=unclassified Nocardioides TaxID=2615069 RepID=UPI0012964876|nr:MULTISPECIES: L,D-transpeptidase [unclassified Nocardioides]MQW75637.1 L,D-transpeptidase family protein [Nocardioides sp. dk4132]QGA08533.1 L,D-transpeptidase family protein [Nocardioides sp. dk884]
MARHRAPLRPRYGRISALAAALLVTLVAVLGGTGVLPDGPGGSAPERAEQASAPVAEDADPASAGRAADEHTSAPERAAYAVVDAAAYAAGLSFDTSLPPGSGQGRRVVYSESRQRVWLVEDGDRVAHTYLVSGTVHDNLEPGTYEVYSRSADAVGIEDSGTMKWFVRFTQGPSGAAIGFHDIPVKDGVPLQGVDELGTPTSHGCIRQRRSDARMLWDFAPLGTTVVVTR